MYEHSGTFSLKTANNERHSGEFMSYFDNFYSYLMSSKVDFASYRCRAKLCSPSNQCLSNEFTWEEMPGGSANILANVSLF